jgi:HK97 family phage portal protein
MKLWPRQTVNVSPRNLEKEYGPVRNVPTIRNESSSTLAKPDPWLIEAFLGRCATSGVRVNPLTAMGVSTVFACINAISRPLAMMPLNIHRRLDGGGDEVASDHYLYSLIHDSPNGEMTSSTWRRALFANAALHNVGYSEILRDGMGDIAEIHPLCHSVVAPARDTLNGPLYYRLNGEKVGLSRILAVRGLTFNGVMPADLIVLAKDAIGLAIALQDHASRYFPNAASPTLVATSPAAHLSDEQIQTIKNEIMARTGGEHAHRPLVLTNGATINPISTPDNQKGQFIESRLMQDKAICQFFGVPQSKAGITENAHYDNVWMENESFIIDCLLPWAVEAEQSLNAALLSKREKGRYFFKFNFDALLRGDPEKRALFYEKLIQMGVMTRNEVRRKENLPPVQGGDVFMVSQNLQVLDKDGKPVPKPESEKTPSAKANS